MKRRIPFIILILFILPFVYSTDSFFDLSFRGLYPELEKPELMGYLNFGYGSYLPIVPILLSPGIYVDVGIGLDWIRAIFGDDSSNNNNRDENFNQLGLNLGIRAFNLIQIGVMDIKPFVGYNFVIGQLDKRASWFIHGPIIGASIVFSMIGLEYCYYVPTRFSDEIAFHHIAVIFRLKEGFLGSFN